MQQALATVKVTLEGDIAFVTMNRPDRLNAMSMELVDDLHAVFTPGETSPLQRARVVVFLGAGRSFCAGADLAANALGLGGRKWDSRKLENQEYFSSLVRKMRDIPQPIICGVQGSAAGGGMALALAADVRIAAASASFVPSFLTIGLSGCELGTSYFLPRLVGLSNASAILMTGDAVNANDAYRMGLVSKIVPDDALVQACRDMANKMLRASPLGLVLTKRQLNSATEPSTLSNTLHSEDVRQLLCLQDSENVKFTAEKSKKFIDNARAKANKKPAAAKL